MALASASASYQILDERGLGAFGSLVQGLGTWTSPIIDVSSRPNLIVIADLIALIGTSPTAQLIVDGWNGTSWGSGDVYSGPVYSTAISHWGFRGALAAGKTRVRVRLVVAGTNPSASFDVTILGATNG